VDEAVVMHATSGRMAIVKEKTIMKRVRARFLSFFFWFSNWFEFSCWNLSMCFTWKKYLSWIVSSI